MKGDESSLLNNLHRFFLFLLLTFFSLSFLQWIVGTDEGDPYYPVPNPENHALYKKYQELAKKEEKEKQVYFVGRLASYKYFNMDAAIDNALDMFNEIEGSPKQPDIEDGKASGDGKKKAKAGTASTVSDSIN